MLQFILTIRCHVRYKESPWNVAWINAAKTKQRPGPWQEQTCDRSADAHIRELTRLGGILQSSQSQAPNPKEAPSTKLQNERPLRLGKGSAVASRPSCPAHWDLRLAASLELGVWSLELYDPSTQKALLEPKR